MDKRIEDLTVQKVRDLMNELHRSHKISSQLILIDGTYTLMLKDNIQKKMLLNVGNHDITKIYDELEQYIKMVL